MTSINKVKQELLVWAVILTIFGVLTLIAVNFDSIRKSALFNSSSSSSGTIDENIELHQPGNSVVLAQ